MSGDASYESNKTAFSSDSENLAISLELATVPLVRGWFDMNLLYSRSWKFDPATVGESYALSRFHRLDPCRKFPWQSSSFATCGSISTRRT